MKRRLTQSIAGLLLVCMAGTTIFGAAATTRQGTPTAPSTNTPNKAPTAPVMPNKAPTAPAAPSKPTVPITPVAPSKPTVPTTPVAPSKPAAPTTPVAPSKPAAPTTPVAPSKPAAPITPVVPSKPATPVVPSKPATPVAPSKPTAPTTPVPSKPQSSNKPSTCPNKPSTCPNKPSTCPNKPKTCPNKPQPFALDNFKVIQATLAGCGVDEQELAAYIKQGKKLEDVLKEEKISTRKFKKRVLKEYCKVIDQAVKDGQLTNEQGAQLKEAIKETVKNWLPKK